MRKKWIVLLVCVLFVVGIGILLWGWCYKGYPTTESVSAIFPLPTEVSMELTEVTNTGGVLACRVDTTEDGYYFHHVLDVDGSNLSVEKQSEDGQWFELAEGKFPLLRTTPGPHHLAFGENLVQVDWSRAYGSLDKGNYRLVIHLCSENEREEMLVAVPFSVF